MSIRKKLYFAFAIGCAILVMGIISGIKVNSDFHGYQLKYTTMELNKVYKNGYSTWKIKKVQPFYDKEDEEYHYKVYIDIPQNKDTLFFENMWINPKYEGANQTIDISDENGKIVQSNYWSKHDNYSGVMEFTLPKERLVESNYHVSFDILLKDKLHYHKYTLPINDFNVGE